MSTILIDGNSLINRAFYALPPLNTDDGVPTQAVYGFCTMLVRLITNNKPDKIAVAFDMRAPTFRHKMCDFYKATRKGMPDDLAAQLPLLKDVLKSMNIAIYEKEGYEADDIIGTLAKRNAGETIIVTGDRDSFQLIDKNISVLFTKRGITDTVLYTEENLSGYIGLRPSQIVDYKALAGDSSDNIPGVNGIGDKTAVQLLQKYGTLNGVFEHIDELTKATQNKLREGKDSAYLSYTLATIKTDVPLDEYDMSYTFPFSEAVRKQFEVMKFKTLIQKENLFESARNEEVETRGTVFDIEILDDIDRVKNMLSEIKSSFAFEFGKTLNISLNGEKEYQIKIKENLFDEGLDLYEVISLLTPYLLDKNILKIVFDIKAVKKALKISVINNVFDVRLAQYLIDMVAENDSLADLSKYYNVENEAYGCALFLIKSKLEPELKNSNLDKLYYEVELPLTDVLFKMEQVGFKVDMLKVEELDKIYAKQIEELTQSIYSSAGFTFNLNSPKQLSEVLFDKMGIPYPDKKKGKRSTGAEVLERLTEYPIVKNILDYRAISKLKTSYIEGFKKLVQKDGVIHTEFNQMLTTTGRLSSKEPNLQNIPVRDERGKQLREVFVSSPGCTLISADYSQIELRLLASFSKDERMCKAYKDGEDIHSATAAEIFDVDISEVTEQMRREAKVVNFGIIYGMSDFGLAQSLNISSSRAHLYKLKYFAKFAKVKEYLDSLIAFAKKTGYAETIMSRKRKIPELSSDRFNLRSFGERVAMNMPLQGSAADIIKIAMVKVDKALEGMKSKLILQIHDELIVDAYDSEIQEVKRILKSNMENCVTLNVPLEVNIESGKRWSEW